MKIGWKVVNKDMKSVSVPSMAAVHYKVGKITKPMKDAGPLCVFTSLQSARNAFSGVGNRFYLCAYVPSNKKCVWTSKLWIHTSPIFFLPNGTALAAEVVLIREVG
jgi:hypothetical protein